MINNFGVDRKIDEKDLPWTCKCLDSKLSKSYALKEELDFEKSYCNYCKTAAS